LRRPAACCSVRGRLLPAGEAQRSREASAAAFPLLVDAARRGAGDGSRGGQRQAEGDALARVSRHPPVNAGLLDVLGAFDVQELDVHALVADAVDGGAGGRHRHLEARAALREAELGERGRRVPQRRQRIAAVPARGEGARERREEESLRAGTRGVAHVGVALSQSGVRASGLV
jgi:hypothetical protein